MRFFGTTLKNMRVGTMRFFWLPKICGFGISVFSIFYAYLHMRVCFSRIKIFPQLSRQEWLRNSLRSLIGNSNNKLSCTMIWKRNNKGCLNPSKRSSWVTTEIWIPLRVCRKSSYSLSLRVHGAIPYKFESHWVSLIIISSHVCSHRPSNFLYLNSYLQSMWNIWQMRWP